MAELHGTRINSPLSSPLPAKRASTSGRMQLSTRDKKQLHDNVGKHVKTRCCISATEAAIRDSRLIFEYLNKGAANVVFKIHPSTLSQSTPSFQFVDVEMDGDNVAPLPYQEFSSKVLRVSRGKPKHLSGEVILSGFKDAIHPLFLPGQLNTLKLITNPGASSTTTPKQVPLQMRIPDLTKHLMDHQGVLLMPSVMEGLLSRTAKDTFHVDDNQKGGLAARLGILLPDMSPVPGSSITLEVKPKWLLQSPNAPSNAIRCRTCALQISIPKDKTTYICPLRLINGNIQDVRSLVYNNVILALSRTTDTSIPTTPPSEQIISAVVDALLEYLTQGDGKTLLQHIRFLQQELDPQGVLLRSSMSSHQDLFDYNIRLAMTLRDCSLFVKIPYNATKSSGGGAVVEAGKITSKLGDLDFKSAEKIQDWEWKERSLQAEELYTRRGERDPDCWLSSSRV